MQFVGVIRALASVEKSGELTRAVWKVRVSWAASHLSLASMVARNLDRDLRGCSGRARRSGLSSGFSTARPHQICVVMHPHPHSMREPSPDLDVIVHATRQQQVWVHRAPVERQHLVAVGAVALEGKDANLRRHSPAY